MNASPPASAHLSEPAPATGGSPTVPPPADPDGGRASALTALGDPDVRRERPLVDLEAVRRQLFNLVLPNLKAHPSAEPGWRLLRATGETHSWIDVTLRGSDGFAVLGSHPGCDLVLTDDRCILRRHLAVVAVRSREDAPDPDVLRLIDLQTGVPIFADDGEPRGTFAAAAFSVRVGHHVLYAYPAGPTGPASDALAGGSAHDREAVQASGLRSSRSGLAGDPPRYVRLTAEGSGVGASAELPMAALDDGIVLGRGRNCFDHGIRRVLDHGAISDAHLLLLRDGDDVLAFDLCSTNGTRAGGHRVRRHRITSAERKLDLGKAVTLTITVARG